MYYENWNRSSGGALCRADIALPGTGGVGLVASAGSIGNMVSVFAEITAYASGICVSGGMDVVVCTYWPCFRGSVACGGQRGGNTREVLAGAMECAMPAQFLVERMFFLRTYALDGFWGNCSATRLSGSLPVPGMAA